MSERITVFDIEVLNQDPASICAIGIVELCDGKEVSSYYSLIKPKNLSYDPYRYRVHKIKSKKLLRERTFDEVYKDIQHYFENYTVVAHDVQGDMACLRAAMKQYKIAYPELKMSCTNVLAHLLWPELEKFNLPFLCEQIGYQYEAHHALEDARAAAQVLLKMMQEEQVPSLGLLHQKYCLDFGVMKEHYYRNIISADMVPMLEGYKENQSTLLYHQAVCFTGKLSIPKEVLEEKTRQVNGMTLQQVSTQTNYLVIGKEGYHKVRFKNRNKKVKKALQLKKQGQDIKIIHENEYIKMLEENENK